MVKTNVISKRYKEKSYNLLIISVFGCFSAEDNSLL